MRNEPITVDIPDATPVAALRWGWRVCRHDRTSRGGYTWPRPGHWAVADAPSEHRDTCPHYPGDGLCAALDWAGAASGDLPVGTVLLLAWAAEDELARATDKVRLRRAWVAAEFPARALAGPGADLRGAYLHCAYLAGVDLTGAYLSGAYLHGAYLAGANLSGTDLHGAYLGEANLSSANLGGAYLGGAYLGDANLVGANLAGADLVSAYLGGANLAGVDLAGVDLHGAYLRGAHLERAP